MNLFLPELIVLITGFLVLIYDLVAIKNDNTKTSILISLVGLAAACAALFQGGSGQALGGRFAVEGLDVWFKFIFLLSTFLTITFTAETFTKKAQEKLSYPAEFLVMILFSVAGMMFLVSSRDLVSLYVSLELATIPLFLLAAWTRDARSGEGAFKYLITGAAASAILLYGLGLIYGLTGEMNLALIGPKLTANPALWLAAGMVLAAVGFKLTLFPFHMWAPDTYEGAPTTVTAFLSVASKAAGLALFFQLYYRVFSAHTQSFSIVIAILAAATMTLGNVVAIKQTQIKRFMAYSAISQAGYLLMGFLGNTHESTTAIVFYLLVYALTNLAAFAVIIHHVHNQGDESIEGVRGLALTHPILALALMVALFGLAGIPPLSGFVGKFFLFSVAAQSGYYWLVALAALNSTVSLYYYLRIIRQMYIEPVNPHELKMTAPFALKFGLTIATVGSVVCGLIPAFYDHIDADTVQWLATLHIPGMK